MRLHKIWIYKIPVRLTVNNEIRSKLKISCALTVYFLHLCQVNKIIITFDYYLLLVFFLFNKFLVRSPRCII